MMFLNFPILIYCIFIFASSIINCTIDEEKKFENLKSEFIKDSTKYKLNNYLRKVKLKNLGIIDDDNKERFYFIDPTEDQLMILNNLKREEIFSDDFENENEKEKEGDEKDTKNKLLSRDKFKAKVFAYLFKNNNSLSAKENSNPIYKILGINLDEDEAHIDGWKIFLVLLNSSSTFEIKNQKLIKVCIPENKFEINFAIVLNFDKSCSEIIEKFSKSDKNLLTDEENSNKISQKLHTIEVDLLSTKIANKKEENYSQSHSFLEKSSQSIEKEEKNYSIDYLAQKFSVEELNKIKFLIKFAKKNEIIDLISKSKGEMTLADLMIRHDMKKGNLMRPNFNVLNTGKLQNETTLIQMMANEVFDLKTALYNQNTQTEILFDEMKKSMNDLKSMIGGKKDEVGKIVGNISVERNSMSKDEEKKLSGLFGYHSGTSTEMKPDGNGNKANNSQSSASSAIEANSSNKNLKKDDIGNNNQGNNYSNMNNINSNNVPMNNNGYNGSMNNRNSAPMNNNRFNGPMNMNGNSIPMNNNGYNGAMNMNGGNMPINNNGYNGAIKMNGSIMPMNNNGNMNSNNIQMNSGNSNSPMNSNINQHNKNSLNNNNSQNNFKFKEANSNSNSENNNQKANNQNNIKRDRPPHNLTLMRRNGKPLSPFLTATNLSSFQDDDDTIEKNSHKEYNKNYIDP